MRREDIDVVSNYPYTCPYPLSKEHRLGAALRNDGQKDFAESSEIPLPLSSSRRNKWKTEGDRFLVFF